MTKIKALLGAVVALAVAAALALPATAHTAMIRASPDRDATAGGSIGHIDLEFLDPVTNTVVTVTYNGVPVAGQTTVADGEVITFTLDQPLAQPGRYQVNYEMTSFDSDFTTGGYFFTLDPTANQVARIEPSGPGGFSPSHSPFPGLASPWSLVCLPCSCGGSTTADGNRSWTRTTTTRPTTTTSSRRSRSVRPEPPEGRAAYGHGTVEFQGALLWA